MWFPRGPKFLKTFFVLQDAKITNVLSLCHDKTILAAVQAIIENMIACEDDKSQQQLHFLQSCGFGGLWRFAGPFTKFVIILLLILINFLFGLIAAIFGICENT